MICILIEKWNDGTFFQTAFNNEKDAIKAYEKSKGKTFNGKPEFSSVQLFEMNADPQEKGNYPIFKPTKKYDGTHWIKTKFHKKFIFDFDKYITKEVLK